MGTTEKKESVLRRLAAGVDPEDGKIADSQMRMLRLILDESRPVEFRTKLLFDLLGRNGANSAATMQMVQQILNRTSQEGQENAAIEEAKLAKKNYENLVNELQKTPPRPATFISCCDVKFPMDMPRANVVTPDGQERVVLVHESVKSDDLVCGMRVYLDGSGAMLIGIGKSETAGQEAVFLRRLEQTDTIEISERETKLLVRASASVLESIESGELRRGDHVVFCPRRFFAFVAVRRDADKRHRFVLEEKVGEVIASRDIGRPHPILTWMLKRLNLMLYRPELLKSFGLRPRVNLLMTGRTGTGKTLTIRAFIYEFVQALRKVSGRSDLGSRVVRVKTSDLLSQWFGQSEQNIEAFFNDVQALASEEVTVADGRRMRLPVIVIFEEAEGLARRRGDWDSGPYDRIIGTVLQRLDDPTEDLSKLPIIWITTSNRPEMFDSAMWRRLSGKKALFTRLDRVGTAAVLSKKLRSEYPYESLNGHSQSELRANVIDQVVAWLFSPNGADAGLVEVTMRDGKKHTHHRRDFLTGAVIEQAVANAIDHAAFAAMEEESSHAGLSAAALIEELAAVIDSLADNLTAQNIADYVDIPLNSAVASVRRLSGGSHSLQEVAI